MGKQLYSAISFISRLNWGISGMQSFAKKALCSSLDEQLIKAIEDNDASRVAILIEQGANCNWEVPYVEVAKLEPDAVPYGIIALMWATRVADLRLVKLLLENGADVKAANNDGWIALASAAWEVRCVRTAA